MRAVAMRRSIRRAFHRADVAWTYAAVVVGVAIVVRVLPGTRTEDLVLDSSTNLDNLRHTPLLVLGASAFVVAPVWGLWILVPLVAVFGAAQRWLGRAATVVVAVLGHVGATLFVAVLLAAGINDGLVDPDVAREPDVGVSYGLAAVAGVLVGRVPRRWRPWYALGVLAVAAGSLLIDRDDTGVGHVVAVLLGLALAVLTNPRYPADPADPARAGPPRTNRG